MNLGDLRTEIKAHLNNRGDVTDARIDSLINLAYKRIARFHLFRDLEGVATYAIPFTGTETDDSFFSLSAAVSDLENRGTLTVTLLDSSTEYELFHIPTVKWRTLYNRPGRWAAKRPSNYHIWGDRFELYPVPDQSYTATFYYRKRPTTLVLDADEPAITTIDDVIINLTLSTIYHSLRNHESGKMHWTIFKDTLAEAMTHDSQNSSVDLAFSTYKSSIANSNYWQDPWITG